MVNWFTCPEMETDLQRVLDNKISDRERAEVAMLTPGMAGCKLFFFFDIFHSLPMPSARPWTSTGALPVNRKLCIGGVHQIGSHESAFGNVHKV